ncbi:MAG: class I SAM-dependent methyltransferase [Rubripirellula sp.]|nr:class I SAM-dependent methyltransferase [Rubripirellula sp.]
MHVDLSELTGGNLQAANGIWSAAAMEEVSYPEEGNRESFRIEDSSYWFQHRNAVIGSLVQHYVINKTESLFLDVGGGNGFQAKAIQDLGFSTLLLEPGRIGCENALKRGVLNVINCALADACIKPNSIAAAGAFDVVEHIDAQEKFLSQIHGVLEPGGYLFMTVPALRWLWSFEDTYTGHFRRYTLKTAASALSQVGFEVEFASYFFRPLVVPIFLLRAIPSALRIRTAADADVTEKEHSLPDSFVGKLIGRGLKKELTRIDQQRKVAIGSSLVMVARKR